MFDNGKILLSLSFTYIVSMIKNKMILKYEKDFSMDCGGCAYDWRSGSPISACF